MDFKKTMDKAIKMYDPILCMNVPDSVKTKDSNSEKTIDKAIRNCDANKNEGYKIYNAVVRGDTLYITFEDLLDNPGKKETESFSKSEAKGFVKDPWNTYLGNTKSVIEKFIGGKVM